MPRPKNANSNPAKRGTHPKKAQTAKVNEVDITERQNKAVALRRQGGSLRAIAKQLGISHEQVRLDIEAVMTEVIAEAKNNVDELRALELEHLDELRLHAMTILTKERKDKDDDWYDVERIKLTAIDRLRRISERRARLLGIDAPDKHEHDLKNFPSISDIMSGKKSNEQ